MTLVEPGKWRREGRQQGKNKIEGLQEKQGMWACLEGSRQSSQTGQTFT